MACGVPVVTTDMAGPVSVVGNLGHVVSIGDAIALADAWQKMLGLLPEERRVWGKEARRRIEDHFSLTRMVESYESLYTERYYSWGGNVGGELVCR